MIKIQQYLKEIKGQMRKVRGYYLALLHNGRDEIFPYSIHGLWPQFDQNHWPQSCSQHEFDPNGLQPLLPKLHKYWHSSRGTDIHFWKHEWERHGTCTDLNEVMYFEQTINCFEKVRDRGKAWVQQRSLKIPFDLNFEIKIELFL